MATALEVIVAPETASISAVWPLISRALSSSAAAWPMLGVSLGISSTTSVIAVSLKVIVTVTVPMPCACALYVPGVYTPSARTRDGTPTTPAAATDAVLASAPFKKLLRERSFMEKYLLLCRFII